MSCKHIRISTNTIWNQDLEGIVDVLAIFLIFLVCDHKTFKDGVSYDT